MYVDITTVDATTTFQGDVITDFPFYLLENSGALRRNRNGQFSRIPEVQGNSGLHAIESQQRNVMVLSQTCDVQRRENVILCPVYNLAEFIRDNTINANSARDIRDRKIYYWFYLPEFLPLQESIADLQTMIYVPRSAIVDFPTRRIASLSDRGRHVLGWSLATFFGRPVQ